MVYTKSIFIGRIQAIGKVFIDHARSECTREHRHPESFLCFSLFKLYSELLHRFSVFALILFLLCAG